MNLGLIKPLLFASALVVPTLLFSGSKALAEDLVFTLNNHTASPLVEFYVETSADSHWGADILTHDVPPGGSGEVTIADGKRTCTYDILGVFADGSKVDERGLNLCELGSYTYVDK